jgi:hypothetical protein
MSGSRIKYAALFKFSLLFLTIIACLSSRSANAESLLLLKSENIKKSSDESYKLSTLGFDDKGNLTIRKGNLTVVLIYNPPSSENENLINKNTVQMVMNHENPEISGIGVKLSYAF